MAVPLNNAPTITQKERFPLLGVALYVSTAVL